MFIPVNLKLGEIRLKFVFFTDNVEVSDLAFHWIRVDLTHIPTHVTLPDVTNM